MTSLGGRLLHASGAVGGGFFAGGCAVTALRLWLSGSDWAPLVSFVALVLLVLALNDGAAELAAVERAAGAMASLDGLSIRIARDRGFCDFVRGRTDERGIHTALTIDSGNPYEQDAEEWLAWRSGWWDALARMHWGKS